MSSPKSSTPFMERMRQSLSGSIVGGGSSGSPTSAGVTGAGGSPASPAGVNRQASSVLLRRRDRETRNALSFAARALTDVVDTVEAAAKKVSLGSIATAVANMTRDKKATTTVAQQAAPAGVTQACSVIFQHVLAPLWAVERKVLSSPNHVPLTTPDCVRLMREMDAATVILEGSPSLLEQHIAALQQSTDLATLFMILLCAKIRWIESQEPLTLPEAFGAANIVGDLHSSANRESSSGSPKSGGGKSGGSHLSITNPSFEQLCYALREEFLHRDDTDSKFEDSRLNDESQTADQSKRRLEEVGGKQWKPKGAVLLTPTVHEVRRSLLLTLMYASIVLTYNYNDVLLQFVVDEITCKQLFLTSFSEGFSALVSGVKGPKYVSKYVVFGCRDGLRDSGNAAGAGGLSALGSTSASGAGGGDPQGSSSATATAYYAVPVVGVDSVLLQDVAVAVELALHNFTHRNDTAPVLFQAFVLAVRQLATNDRMAPIALFHRISVALKVSYIADMELLVALVDEVKLLVTRPNPIGSGALGLLEQLFANLRNVNALQRDELQKLFVGGPERSFRRVPAYVIVTPFCARAHVFTQIFWGSIDQRRGENINYPAVLPAGMDPQTRLPLSQFDDTTTCISNNLINIFQALYELQSDDDDSSTKIDLRLLFSISPTTLAALFPAACQLLDKVGGLSFSSIHKNESSLQVLREMYMTIQDRHRPASGAVKFRLECPWLPVIPLRLHKFFEKDDLEVILKTICDDFATSCDARINERDVAYLHPTNHLSLRMYVDSSAKIVLGGGSGLLRRAVTAALRLQQNYPGTFVRPLFYMLPLGYGNDIAAWLARVDPVYRERVFNPLLAAPVSAVDPPSQEQWQSLPQSTDLLSLVRRDYINDFLTFGSYVNEIVVYQAECQFLESFYGSCYIPFVSNFEVGVHINNAVLSSTKNGTLPSNLMIAPSVMVHGSSFSTEKFRQVKSGLSRQNTSQSSGSDGSNPNMPLGTSQSSSSFVLVSPSTAHTPSTANAFSITIGESQESLDRILTRMHGARGIPTSTKQHLLDGSELQDAASGEDILDWISTSYHMYDLNAAKSVAQALLDSKLLIALSVPLGKDPQRFTDAGLYAIIPREDIDAQPLCPPSSKSSLCEQSNLHRLELEDFVTGSGASGGLSSPMAAQGVGPNGGPSCMKLRVTFQSYNALQYNDLVDSKDTQHREIVYIKLKSSGSPDDIGSLANPTLPTLAMTCLQDGKRKSGSGVTGASRQQRDLGELLDHYQIKFGERDAIDPRNCLQFDFVPRQADAVAGSQPLPFANNSFGVSSPSDRQQQVPPPASVKKSADQMGMYCMCDGDVFGPFSNIRIKPVAVKMVDKDRASYATASVMSFVKPL